MKFAVLAAFLVAACASVPLVEIAPTGDLRVAIGVGPSPSAFWATRDASGPRGVTVDLGRAAAARLGVPVRFVEYRNAGEITAGAAKGEWDITFMPHEAEREKLMDHGPAYVNYDSTYIVRAGLDARTPAELDRKGIHVGAISGTSTSRTAARSLKQAAIVLIPKAEEAVAQFAQGKVDALAMGREALEDIARKVPGSRVLAEPIQQTGVMIVVPKERPATRTWAARFMQDAKADGTVRRALDGAGFANARVAP
jgi:polar amino acid transport system substrate-binding protein